MIKGAQKQMIVLRTADSRYFDEAYFVLRREIDARPAPMKCCARQTASCAKARWGRQAKPAPKGGAAFGCSGLAFLRAAGWGRSCFCSCFEPARGRPKIAALLLTFLYPYVII